MQQDKLFLLKSVDLFKGAVSRGFCRFRSILSQNHYFEALIINKMLHVSLSQRYQMILSERANHNKFFEDFWNTQHQNLKKLANFFNFQSTSIRSDKRQETVSVPSNSLQ